MHLNHQTDLLSVISVLVWQLLLISVLCRVLWECAVDIQLLTLLWAILTVTEVLCSVLLEDVDTGLWGRKQYASLTCLHFRNSAGSLKSLHMCYVVITAMIITRRSCYEAFSVINCHNCHVQILKFCKYCKKTLFINLLAPLWRIFNGLVKPFTRW